MGATRRELTEGATSALRAAASQARADTDAPTRMNRAICRLMNRARQAVHGPLADLAGLSLRLQHFIIAEDRGSAGRLARPGVSRRCGGRGLRSRCDDIFALQLGAEAMHEAGSDDRVALELGGQGSEEIVALC